MIVSLADAEAGTVAWDDDRGDLEDAGAVLLDRGRVDIESAAGGALPDPEVGESGNAVVGLHKTGNFNVTAKQKAKIDAKGGIVLKTNAIAEIKGKTVKMAGLLNHKNLTVLA